MSIRFKIFLLGFSIGVIGLVIWLKKNSENENLNYEFAYPVKGNVLNKVYVSGYLVSEKEVILKSEISGVLDKFYVEIGQAVKKDQPIAKVKLYPDPDKLEVAKKNVRIAKVDLEIAESQYFRNKRLFEIGAISKEEFEPYIRRWKIATEELSYAKKQSQIVGQGFSDSEINKSDIIYSTISGTVLELYLKEGNPVIERNTFNEGSDIASIADMQEIIFKGKVAEKDIDHLKIDMPLKVKLNNFRKNLLDARLTKISPRGAIENGVTNFDIECKIALNQIDTINIRSGYSAVAEIILERANNTLILEEKYIQFKSDSAFVCLFDEGKRKHHLIKTGISDGINIQILNGIDENSQVHKVAD